MRIDWVLGLSCPGEAQAHGLAKAVFPSRGCEPCASTAARVGRITAHSSVLTLGSSTASDYRAASLTALLFLLKDSDDADPTTQVALPPDVWELISRILLREILGIPPVQQAAERLGVNLAQ